MRVHRVPEHTTVKHRLHLYSWARRSPAPFGSLDVVPVPEPERVKNRVDLDVTCRAVEDRVAHGAVVLRTPTDAAP